MMNKEKYKVEEPRKLASWRTIAIKEITKKISIKTIAIIVLFVLPIVGDLLSRGRQALTRHHQKDDTTITCKNGKCDTVIVKGYIPDWLK
jgi:hypothetical protein